MFPAKINNTELNKVLRQVTPVSYTLFTCVKLSYKYLGESQQQE